jgi:hypothetical protein
MILPWIFKQYLRSKERFPMHVCHRPSAGTFWDLKLAG